MISTILHVLKQNHINTYLLTQTKIESLELFFIKKELDMTRKKDVTNYSLTIYRDFEKNDTKMRGSSTITLSAGMTKEEIDTVIKNSYYAASFVNNPYYELPKGQKEDTILVQSSLSSLSLEESAKVMVDALFAFDRSDTTFLNSAELFVSSINKRIINSEGIDVSYIKYNVKGEFVAQCISPQDVETYQSFMYDDLDSTALKEKVRKTLEMTNARAIANTTPSTGKMKVILSDQYVKTIISYYMSRSNASMIYPNYSTYKIGTKVQGEDVIGEKLNITLKADSPYSGEGITMIDRELVKEGTLINIHGSARFSHYLGITPTGEYQKVYVDGGTKTLEEIKSGSYLHVVNFSDFQMDDFTGQFSGEIRLAFLSDGESVIPVTGGSISGNILEAQKNITFSIETQVEEGYIGPLAVSFEEISVAGI